ncbi:MAG: hypothetical protein Q9160_004375 [Pyrenula sp. 1 TL-2023]
MSKSALSGISDAPPTQTEVDFESYNWNNARAAFMQRHKDNEKRQKFLKKQTTGSAVKEKCLELQNTSDRKYSKGLGGILSKVDALMKVGDLAIKSAPESVGLAWMGVRLCLHSVQDDFATFQVFSQACADVIGIMISCRVYGKMYGHPEGPSDFQELHSKVVEYIPTIYASILDFSYAVQKHTDKNALLRIGKGMFSSSKNEFQDQITAIQQAEAKMNDYAQMATNRLVVHYQKQGLQGQEVMSADIAMMKEVLHANLKANEAFVKHIEQLEEERKDMRRRTPYEKAKDEFEEIKKALNPADDQTGLYEERLKRREDNTCRWIFDLDEYKSWQSKDDSNLLWVNGGPGYGKSILMATVIESLKADRTDAHDYLVQYFFCRGGDDATQTTARILQSLVYQLCALAVPSPELLDKCNEVMRKSNNNKKSSGKLDDAKVKTYNIQSSFGGLVKALGKKVYLVVDALDECIDRKEKGLVKELLDLVHASGSQLKVLVCSRPESDLGDALSAVLAIKCEGRNEEDIRKNVKAELSTLPGWTSAEKESACEAIVRKSSGQFRYVDIALKILRKPLSRPFEKTFANLPDGLYSSYAQSLEQTDADYLELLKTSLTWSILAEGSIKVSEVMDAYSKTYSPDAGIEEAVKDVSVDVASAFHDSQIRIAGGNFLDVSSQTHVISLRHASVRDYFLRTEEEAPKTNDDLDHICSKCSRHRDANGSFKISEKTGHFEIAQILIQNLNSPAFQRKYLPSIDDERHRLEQTDSNSEQASNQQEKVVNGTDDASKAALTPIINGVAKTNEKTSSESGSDLTTSNGSLQGKESSDAKIITPSTEDIPPVDEDTHLQKEIKDQTPEIVTGEKDAESVSKGEIEDQKPSNGDEEFYDDEEYIDEEEPSPTEDPSGVPANADESRYELTHWAYHLKKAEAEFSHSERETSGDWVKLWKSLIDFMCRNPAAFNAWQKLQWSEPDSPLQYRTDERWTPLQVAAGYDLTALAEQLIKKGEDVNASSAEGAPTPLQLAAQGSNLDLMKLLLGNGAKPNHFVGERPAPVHWAIYFSPNVETIQLFVDHGADLTTLDGYGLNAMHYFSWNGTDVEALKVLLSSGCDINVKDDRGETPLHKLVSRTDLPLELLQAYLAAHAGVNVEDNDSQMPLFEVALVGNVEAARVLIDGGADIFDDDVDGMTALHAAAAWGHTAMVKLLLEKAGGKSSDLKNQPDKHLRTPLYHALQCGQAETAQYLLEALSDQPGDEINKGSRDGRTPFRKAAARGYLKLVELLLEKIDPATAINAKDSKLEQTSLHTASYNGQNEVVEFLLKVGADLSATDRKGRTPLQLCGEGWVKNKADSAETTLLFLIDSDKASAANSKNLLFLAAMKNSVKVIERLLNAGADPNMEDEHGWTPLLIAQQYQQQEAVEALSKKGAIIRTRPTKWVSSLESVSISDDGLEVATSGAVTWGFSVVSNHPISAGSDRYYFEIEIVSAETPPDKEDAELAYSVGLTTLPAKLKQFPGYNNPGARTWAWHGDDGSTGANSYNPKQYGGGPYEVGSVIGCGIDFVEKTIFYTKNGEKLPTIFEDVTGRLFPVVGIMGKVVLRANFGTDKARPFKWEAASLAGGWELPTNGEPSKQHGLGREGD